jgi:hypothetical protein
LIIAARRERIVRQHHKIMNCFLRNFFGLPCGIAASVLLFSTAPASADQPPTPVMIPGFASSGSATVSPAQGTSGEFGTWTVTFTVGEGGIETGGGVRVQLPDSWHSGPRNSAISLQASDSTKPHYVLARVSRSGVKVAHIVESENSKQELIKHSKLSLDGRNERYVFVARVWLTEGRLQEGDTISVIYGDRSGGSAGMLAPAIATDSEPVLVAVDAAGKNKFQRIKDAPLIQSLAGEPVEMLVHAPSQATPGRPVQMLVALLDKQYNPVMRPVKLRVSLVTGNASFSARLNAKPEQGRIQFQVTPKRTGVLRIKVEAPDLKLSAVSNPTDVIEVLSQQNIYWGDLHSHARLSWDGVGDHSFEYARHVAGLDFYALTDHAIAPTGGKPRGLSESTWPEAVALTDKFHDPPHFVTFHAYEASFSRPYGHHNIYFRDRPGPFIYPERTSLDELWKMASAGEVLTIPHHTGKFPGGIDFAHHHPDFRRNFEIYSGHGSSEVYAPGQPLSFERSTFTSPSMSLPSPTFAQDAWKRGLLLSTIAASDDHRGQPGQPHYGLAAVRAPALTRNDIFQALHDRHTYGTTGAKIILDFSLNGTPMGQSVKVGSAPVLKVRALGAGVIERIELLKWQKPAEKFAVLHSWHPNALDFEGEYRDDAFAAGAIYYVRLRQKENIRDHLVKAWSSPIWTLGADAAIPGL